MQSEKKQNIFLAKLDGITTQVFDYGDYKVACFYTKNHYEGSPNEDVLFCKLDEDGLFVGGVADGAGGHPKGEEAAFTIGEEIVKKSSLSAPLELIEQINTKVIDLKVGAKSTLAFYTIEKDMFRCHCVGDSEIVYWNSGGGEVYSSIPHSLVGYGIEAGLINQEDSLDNPQRHIVSHLLGDEIYRVESSSSITMKKGHTVLVGTDGLFDNISHESLAELVGRGLFEKGFEDLVSLCTKQGDLWKKNDDIAFILIRKMKS